MKQYLFCMVARWHLARAISSNTIENESNEPQFAKGDNLYALSLFAEGRGAAGIDWWIRNLLVFVFV